MKLSLVVLTTGKMEGKSIPISLPQFIIGRDPQCHLRPASALISKRHCAVIMRENKAFVRDFGSTNGTFVNAERVEGEKELHDQDSMQVGPLEFRVNLEISVSRQTPPPQPAVASADEAAAALLLSLQDDGLPLPNGPDVDSQGIPTGSTVMEVLKPPTDPAAGPGEAKSGAADREKAAKTAQGNTSSAAKAILEKYMRRPRG